LYITEATNPLGWQGEYDGDIVISDELREEAKKNILQKIVLYSCFRS
jgi:hypothetical protein